MKRYLLDTNHLGEAIGRVSIVRDRIQQLHRQGDIFATCVPAVCELLADEGFNRVLAHIDASSCPLPTVGP
jgi:hypothetical protein